MSNRRALPWHRTPYQGVPANARSRQKTGLPLSPAPREVPVCRRAAVPPYQVWTTHGAPARGKKRPPIFLPMRPHARRSAGARDWPGKTRGQPSPVSSRLGHYRQGAAASPRADEWTGEGTNNREGGVHPIGRRGRSRRVVRPPAHRGLARAHRRGDAPLRARDRTAGLPSTG